MSFVLHPTRVPAELADMLHGMQEAAKEPFWFRCYWFGVLAWNSVATGSTRPVSALRDWWVNVTCRAVQWTFDGDKTEPS